MAIDSEDYAMPQSANNRQSASALDSFCDWQKIDRPVAPSGFFSTTPRKKERKRKAMTTKTVPSTIHGMIRKYANVRAQLKELKTIKKELSASIIDAAGESRRLDGYKGEYAIITESSRTTCSISKLCKERPDIYTILADAGIISTSAPSKSVRVYGR